MERGGAGCAGGGAGADLRCDDGLVGFAAAVEDHAAAAVEVSHDAALVLERRPYLHEHVGFQHHGRRRRERLPEGADGREAERDVARVDRVRAPALQRDTHLLHA